MKITAIIVFLVGFILYGMIGTSGNVAEIRRLAPQEIESRGWDLLRYEGYQFGSFGRHGGYAWYHVANKDNHSIQYRVNIAMWNGELEFYYGEPEKLSRLQLNLGE